MTPLAPKGRLPPIEEEGVEIQCLDLPVTPGLWSLQTNYVGVWHYSPFSSPFKPRWPLQDGNPCNSSVSVKVLIVLSSTRGSDTKAVFIGVSFFPIPFYSPPIPAGFPLFPSKSGGYTPMPNSHIFSLMLSIWERARYVEELQGEAPWIPATFRNVKLLLTDHKSELVRMSL